jgi:hypothetical protein
MRPFGQAAHDPPVTGTLLTEEVPGGYAAVFQVDLRHVCRTLPQLLFDASDLVTRLARNRLAAG